MTDVVFNGDNIVNYYDRSYLASRTHRDCLIAFKDPRALLIHGFDQKYLWTADRTSLTATERKFCNGLFAISDWHLHELKSVNIGYREVFCIEPGIVARETSMIRRIPKQCLYASSPDRGLDFLEFIWPEVKLAHPDATLIVTYKQGNRRTNDDMDLLYQQSDVLAYPCTGQERYCLTAIKAQIHGCIPCVIPHMALRNTVQFGIKCLKRDYLDAIIELLHDSDSRAKIREDMTKNVKYNTWDNVVDRWESVIGQGRQKDKGKT